MGIHVNWFVIIGAMDIIMHTCFHTHTYLFSYIQGWIEYTFRCEHKHVHSYITCLPSIVLKKISYY
jgi:hypothetical protein